MQRAHSLTKPYMTHKNNDHIIILKSFEKLENAHSEKNLQIKSLYISIYFIYHPIIIFLFTLQWHSFSASDGIAAVEFVQSNIPI